MELLNTLFLQIPNSQIKLQKAELLLWKLQMQNKFLKQLVSQICLSIIIKVWYHLMIYRIGYKEEYFINHKLKVKVKDI